MKILVKLSDFVKRKLGAYDSHGSLFSKKHIQSMKYDISVLPLAMQARYADAMTVKNVNNRDFIRFSALELYNIQHLDHLFSTDGFDAVSIGNLAFIALNSSDKTVRNKCLDILEKYRNFVKSQKLNVKPAIVNLKK